MPAGGGGCPALSHVVRFVWVSVMEVGDDGPVDGPDVAVPGCSLDVLTGAVDDGVGVFWSVGVMVVSPNLRVQACSAESRADEVLGDGSGLVLVLPHLLNVLDGGKHNGFL